jgi:iron complex outermembrane receptor protein
VNEGNSLVPGSLRRAAAALAAAWLAAGWLAAGPVAAGPVAAAPADAQNPSEALELPNVVVIGTTALPGIGLPLERVAGNVQAYTSQDLAAQHPDGVAGFLEQNAGSVNFNSAQGNPFQPDLLFRGFTASPLLGTPQGVSVFQDGVRVNEPFADVVNWDLIPESAIANVQLIPGSNPAFGLNALGGAVALYTKSGRDYPGAALELGGGSFGRRQLEFEYGAQRGAWDLFATGNYLGDDGWAEHNPSLVRQLFLKAGYETGRSNVDLSFTAADNTLEGTQTIPRSFLDDPRQAYTYPDRTHDQLVFAAVQASRFLADGILLGASLYVRHNRNESLASDANNDFGAVDPASGAIDSVEATNDDSFVDQRSAGGGLQLTLKDSVRGAENQFVLGVATDAGNARYAQRSQPAAFTATRATVGLGAFATVTDASTDERTDGVYLADTLLLDPRWGISVAGRYSRALVRIADETGMAPQLDGKHRYARLNPAVGVTFNPTKALTAFATWNQGMRVPTPIELACADPGAPCRLPNSFVADPPLAAIVSRTVELGARGHAAAAASWSAAVYRTDLEDDLAFISSGGASTSSGYFRNVGATRRQGLELAATVQRGRAALTLDYGYLDATYRTRFASYSPDNSSADATGAIEVRPGDRLPGIPRHSLKARADYAASERWSGGLTVRYSSAVFARGDENNADRNGMLAGFVTVGLDARYAAGRTVELFARVDNLLDRRYANFAVLGSNVFTGPGNSFDGAHPRAEQFRGVGAPRGAWAGIRYRLP